MNQSVSFLYHAFSVIVFVMAVSLLFILFQRCVKLERTIKRDVMKQHVIQCIMINEEGD